MPNGIFLTNPDFNEDNVTATPSTPAMGRRAGRYVAAAGNSGLLTLSASGDAGDDVSHVVEIWGSQQLPTYNPKDDSGTNRYSDPTAYQALGSITTASQPNGLALTAIDDKFYGFIVEAAATRVLRAYVWNGSAWTLVTSLTLDTDGRLSAAVCAVGKLGYIAVQNGTDDTIDFFVFNSETGTLATAGVNLASPSTSTKAVAIATDGKKFVVLIDVLTDTHIYVGSSLQHLRKLGVTMHSLFGTTWAANNKLDRPAISWTETQGFVAAMRANAGATSTLKVAQSDDGSAWSEWTNPITGVVQQPTVTLRFGDAKTLGIAMDGTQIWVYRAYATVEDAGGGPSAILVHYYHPLFGWVAEATTGATGIVTTNTAVSAANWRGGIFFGWTQSSTIASVRKTNVLSTSVVLSRRVLNLGHPNYVDGPEDDTQTALFITPRGRFREGDSFTIPPYYDYAASNVLVEALGETYRTADNATPNVVLNAGTGRRHIVDAIAYYDTNVPARTFQMNATDSWGGPSQSFSLSCVLNTLTVSSADGNRVVFTTSPFKKGELAIRPRYANLSTGIFRIVDNGPNWILVDGNPGSPSTGAGAATIFGDRMGYFPSESVYQYARDVFPTALQVPDDYYETGRIIIGSRMDLSKNYGVEFRKLQSQIANEIATRSGRRLPRSLNAVQPRAWELRIPADSYSEVLLALEGFYARTEGSVRQFVFWPAGTAEPNNFEIARFVGDPLTFQNVKGDIYSSDTFRILSEVP